MSDFIRNLLIHSVYYFFISLSFVIVVFTIVITITIRKKGWKWFITKMQEEIKNAKEFYSKPPIDIKEQKKKWKNRKD